MNNVSYTTRNVVIVIFVVVVFIVVVIIFDISAARTMAAVS